MAQLDKTQLYAQIDAKFPVVVSTKVRSQDANSLMKDFVDSVVNTIDDAASLAGNVGTFSDFETIIDAGLIAI